MCARDWSGWDVDMEAVAQQLEKEGVTKFVDRSTSCSSGSKTSAAGR